jgi:hypothetical protein
MLENSSFTANVKTYESSDLFELSKKINIYATIFVTLIGLIGHSLIISVFGQKRFRTSSNSVFLLCLAINDSLFLIVHFFEDTLRTFIQVYINESNSNEMFNKFIQSLNLTDTYDFTCRLINYLRFILRFSSSYILVVFTIQRLHIIHSPFHNKFKSNKSAWLTCLTILIISFIINIWVLILFELTTDINEIENTFEKTTYCDVSSTNIFVQIPAVYICIDMLIPIIVILTCNLLIIVKLKSSRKKIEKISNIRITKSAIPSPLKNKTTNNDLLSINNLKASFKSIDSNISSNRLSKNYKLTPFYSSVNQLANRTAIKDSRNTHKNLILISFLFVVLNLPFLIDWFLLYFIYFENSEEETHTKDLLMASLQICEVFHVLNFCILFYVYCAVGTKFRSQLKYFGIFFLNYYYF